MRASEMPSQTCISSTPRVREWSRRGQTPMSANERQRDLEEREEQVYIPLRKATLSAVIELTLFEYSSGGADQEATLSSCEPSSRVILWVEEMRSDDAAVVE